MLVSQKLTMRMFLPPSISWRCQSSCPSLRQITALLVLPPSVGVQRPFWNLRKNKEVLEQGLASKGAIGFGCREDKRLDSIRRQR